MEGTCKINEKLCIVIMDNFNEESMYLLQGASQIKKDSTFKIEVIVYGVEEDYIRKRLSSYPIDVIWCVKKRTEECQIDFYVESLVEMLRYIMPKHIWGTTSTIIKNVFPRVAIRMKAGLCADCTKICFNKTLKEITLMRRAMNGNTYAEIGSRNASMQMATLNLYYDELVLDENHSEIKIYEFKYANRRSIYHLLMKKEMMLSQKKMYINNIVIGVGAGVSNKVFDNIKKIALYLDATIVCTRKGAVKFNSYVQVGLTGKRVSPQLYIAIGISGSSQHMEGVFAKTLIAINSDPNAQIVGQADYYVIDDAKNVMECWMKSIGLKS